MIKDNQKKWVHIIGIAGVTTSALAIEFQRNGWIVTGSDKKIYPPTNEILDEANIKYFEEFKFSNLIKDFESYEDSKTGINEGRKPGLVVMASQKPSSMKELKFAQKHNLNIKSYPEVLNSEVIVKDKSIVVAGTYGKTSVTSMLVYIFQQITEVSYMFGGFVESIPQSLKFKDENTEYSIVEGDEYQTSKYLDTQSKFFHYDPDILVLTSLEWDHTDLFTSKESYLDNFQELIKQIPKNGKIFYRNTDQIKQVLKNANCEIIELKPEDHHPKITNFNDENLAFALQVAENILGTQKIQEIKKLTIRNFSGIKRRLEKRYEKDKLVIIDDFGSSPAKAKGTIENIKSNYPDKKLVIIFEPNEGARTQESLTLYDGVFDEIDLLILPKFREIKSRINEEELYDYLKDQLNSKIFLTDNITNTLKGLIGKDEYVIAFLGSHNFEKDIQESISTFKNTQY